ncbi:hypothetical protein E2C01_023283 [Portunus trituberculatus]|uniref:Uncharacterized protein n=1 Tax=Portunus trituberculatus TaxID=210409 RepID=A0A5B7E9D4_PORTR|nr:hypothetical protein [Portunus trituberculatus]
MFIWPQSERIPYDLIYGISLWSEPGAACTGPPLPEILKGARKEERRETEGWLGRGRRRGRCEGGEGRRARVGRHAPLNQDQCRGKNRSGAGTRGGAGPEPLHRPDDRNHKGGARVTVGPEMEPMEGQGQRPTRSQ